MQLAALFCETPGQSLVVGLAAGVLGGLVGLTLGWGVLGGVLGAAGLALLGELGGHLLRGDEEFREATQQIRDR